MPAAFLYMLALVMWILFACLVWLVAGVLMFSPRTRPLSRPLSCAVAATFPFVFLYQLIASPVVVGVFAAAVAVWKIVEPAHPEITQNASVVGVFLALLSAGTMLVMSLAGFYEGWRTGWAWGKGRRVRDVIFDGPTSMLLLRVYRSVRCGLKPGAA